LGLRCTAIHVIGCLEVYEPNIATLSSVPANKTSVELAVCPSFVPSEAQPDHVQFFGCRNCWAPLPTPWEIGPEGPLIVPSIIWSYCPRAGVCRRGSILARPRQKTWWNLKSERLAFKPAARFGAKKYIIYSIYVRTYLVCQLLPLISSLFGPHPYVPTCHRHFWIPSTAPAGTSCPQNHISQDVLDF